MTCLQHESQHLFKKLDLEDKLLGWQYILADKCLQNELMDVHSINMPNFKRSQNNKDWFVYTCLLNPGYHKLLIYDPKMEMAFVKDFVVNLNLKEGLFPEYPV